MLFSSLLGVTGMFLAARLQPELAIFLILKQLVQLHGLALLFGAPDASRLSIKQAFDKGIEGLQGKYPTRRNDGSEVVFRKDQAYYLHAVQKKEGWKLGGLHCAIHLGNNL